jgi:hypothetical protein
MFRATHCIAAACLACGLTLLLNPPTAQARRPSSVTSKTYPSGKYIPTDPDISLTTPDDSDTPDMTIADRPTCQPNREPLIVHRPTMAVHAYKPLHASLPHATKQFPKFAGLQDGR